MPNDNPQPTTLPKRDASSVDQDSPAKPVVDAPAADTDKPDSKDAQRQPKLNR